MGYKLVLTVRRHWTHLNGNAFRVLIEMAAMALDDDEPPLYFGGRDPLLIVMGRLEDWPPDGDESPAADRVRKNGWEAVRKVVQDLRNSGAISVKARGRPDRHAEYRLHLNRPDTHANPEESCVPTQKNPGKSQKNPGKSQKNPAPKEQEEQEEQGGGPKSPPAVPHQGLGSPVDNKPARSKEDQLRWLEEQMAKADLGQLP